MLLKVIEWTRMEDSLHQLGFDEEIRVTRSHTESRQFTVRIVLYVTGEASKNVLEGSSLYLVVGWQDRQWGKKRWM